MKQCAYVCVLIGSLLCFSIAGGASNGDDEILHEFADLTEKQKYFEAKQLMQNVQDLNLMEKLFAIILRRNDCQLIKHSLDIAKGTQNTLWKNIIKVHKTVVEEKYLVCAIDLLRAYLLDPNSKRAGILSTLDQLPQELQQRIISNAIDAAHERVDVKKLLMGLRLSWYSPYKLYIVAFLLRKLHATNRLDPQSVFTFAKYLRVLGNSRGLRNVAASTDVRQFQDVLHILPRDIRILFFAKRMCVRHKNTMYYLAADGSSYSPSFGVQGGAYWEATQQYEEENIVLTNSKSTRSLVVYLRADLFVPTEELTQSLLLDGVHKCADMLQLVPFVSLEHPEAVTYLFRGSASADELVCVRDGAISYDARKTVTVDCMWELRAC